MDNTDKKILEILQSSARVTNVQLAQAVALSPPAVLERVKKLEEKGIIQKYVTLLDENKVGRGTQAFVAISLEMHEPKSIEGFTEAVRECPSILECYHLAGEEDYLIKVAVGDIAEYEDFLRSTLTRMPGVRKIRTQFVLSTIKKVTELSLGHLATMENNGNARTKSKAKNKETQ